MPPLREKIITLAILTYDIFTCDLVISGILTRVNLNCGSLISVSLPNGVLARGLFTFNQNIVQLEVAKMNAAIQSLHKITQFDVSRMSHTGFKNSHTLAKDDN